MAAQSTLTRLMLALLLVASAAGCGTRLKDADFVAAGAEGTRTVRSGQSSGPSTQSSGAASTVPAQAGTQGQTLGGNASTTGDGGAAPGPGGAAQGPNQASDTGVTETAIKVGNITAVNGALGPDAFSPLMRGVKLYFQVVNEQGGINGRKVDFQTCDDAENPNQNKSCAQKLIEGSGVFALVGNSTDTYSAASYVNSKGVPDIGSYPIGNAYYKYPYLFAVIGSDGYARDGTQVGAAGQLYAQTAQYRYFRDTVGVSKAAVLFYNIAISATAGKFIADGLQREGIQVVYTPNGGGGILPTQQSYDSDVIAMRNAGVNGIWNSIDIAGFQKLCLAMDRNSFTVKANVSTSQGWSQKVGRDFSSPCRSTVYANSVSAPYSSTENPIIAQIVDAKNRFDPQGYMHQWVVEGYAGGMLFNDAVSSMGPAPTRQGVVDFLNGLVDYTYNGLFGKVDWRRSRDYSVPDSQCYSIAKWDDGAGSFVNALGGETVHCEPGVPYYSYVPNDDGS